MRLVLEPAAAGRYDWAMLPSVPETARCLVCEYPLRGLPTPVCPECGRAFDPSDPKTFRVGPRPPWWQRRENPPGVWHAVLTVAVSLILLDGRSRPAGAMGNFVSAWCCIVLAAAPILLATYGLHTVVVLVCRSSTAVAPHTGRRRRLRWIVLPVCLALVLSALPWNWPLFVRFACSRSAMEREARQALSRSATGLAPTMRGRVGLYWVDQVVVDATVPCAYLFTDSGVLAPIGFAWCPSGPSPECVDVNLPAGWYVHEDVEWRRR